MTGKALFLNHEIRIDKNTKLYTFCSKGWNTDNYDVTITSHEKGGLQIKTRDGKLLNLIQPNEVRQINPNVILLSDPIPQIDLKISSISFED